MTSIQVVAPCSGKLVNIETVPSDTFSQKMMGDGFAIVIDGDKVIAPFDGVVEAAFPTGHAVAITSSEGVGVLLHIGIDTYNVEGAFTLNVAMGDQVKQGDTIIKVNIDRLKEANACLISPIVFTNGEKVKLLKQDQFVVMGETDIVEITQ